MNNELQAWTWGDSIPVSRNSGYGSNFKYAKEIFFFNNLAFKSPFFRAVETPLESRLSRF